MSGKNPRRMQSVYKRNDSLINRSLRTSVVSSDTIKLDGAENIQETVISGAGENIVSRNRASNLEDKIDKRMHGM